MQASEYADENVSIAAASAAVLYPCSCTPSPDELYALLGSDAAAAHAGTPGAEDGEAGDSSNPLFNTRGLQCWILQACQQLKGGLRDKPGKPADYYHTCYCLSGLSTAQHIAGGGAVGPAQNMLQKVDPLANIVAEKLQEAKHYFAATGSV